jgi:hypothetical protein
MREVPLQCLTAVTEKVSRGVDLAILVSDENDPHGANRIRSTKPLGDRKLSSPPRKQGSNDQEDPKPLPRRSSSASRTSGRLSGEFNRAGDEKTNVGSGVLTRSRKQAIIPLGTKPQPTTTIPSATIPAPIVLAHPALASGSTAAGVERRGYVRQFEVYNENKPSTSSSSRVNSQQQQLHLSGDMVPKRSKTCERERRTSSSSGTDHLQKPSSLLRHASQRYTSLDDEETDRNNEEEENLSQRDALNEGVYLPQERSGKPDNHMEIVQRFESEDAGEEGVQEIQLNMEQHFQIKSVALDSKQQEEDGVLDEGVVDLPAGGRDAWALCDLEEMRGETAGGEIRRVRSTTGAASAAGGYVTPTRPRVSLGDDDLHLEYPDTLECMYQNLETSFQPSSSHHLGAARSTTPLLDTLSTSSPKIWVVKYVDYTSKYGLGFLLNTNSAGVYFNDSTKIILSPDGQIFQYIERRRRGSTGVIEHLVHTHSLRSYPADLTKKVTLLKHFKNYLMEQLTSTGAGASAAGIGGGASVPPSSSTAGEENVNPVWLNTYLERTVVMQADTPVLPYVKKWVRTRHAILFRLSNRSVQVVFFDNRLLTLLAHLCFPHHPSLLSPFYSEIILSSEARIVTFLNKEGIRSHHRLDTIFSSGSAPSLLLRLF